jgi:hypothetical protein
MPDMNYQSTIAAFGLPKEITFPNQLSHLERVSYRPDNLPLQFHGPDNRLLQSTSLVNQLQAQVEATTENRYGIDDDSINILLVWFRHCP